MNDKRGRLFYDYIRILKAKQPLFFLAENVSGMLLDCHKEALAGIKQSFMDAGYHLYFKMLNACDYGVPQDRKRVFFIGVRNDIKAEYVFPDPLKRNTRSEMLSLICQTIRHLFQTACFTIGHSQVFRITSI